jgi:hypothetical protein
MRSKFGKLSLLNCTMRFSRVTVSDADDYLNIKIEDHNSSAVVCDIEMPVHEFAEFMTMREAKIKTLVLNAGDHVGKKMETRTISIPVLDTWGYASRDVELNDLAKGIVVTEYPGWELDEITWNRYCVSKKRGKTVHSAIIRRWV